MQLTFRYRVKDKHVAQLAAQAAAVNYVWNFCNETQMRAAKSGRKWLGYRDLDRLTKGATKEGLDLHSQSVQKICEQYDTSRRQHRKPWLNWRKTRGVRRSLGWVPFNGQALKIPRWRFCLPCRTVWRLAAPATAGRCQDRLRLVL
jgi:putative transposase